MKDSITITNARLHNLKNVTLSIPKGKFVVLTGLSGSGKSTLGFDILLKEGQRQYFESWGLVSFGLSKPPVDSIAGLSPSISVDQYLSNHSPRSTVGTTTEIFTYLRVLFARLGHRPCPPVAGTSRRLMTTRRSIGTAMAATTSKRRPAWPAPLRGVTPGAWHGQLLVQQAGGGLPGLHRAGDGPPRQPEAAGE
jgi:excinuclease UvrABC ATPase subunit